MQIEWVEDGHRVVVAWDKDQFVVERVDCPFEGTGAFCNRRRNYCVVQRFLHVFGPECNIGVTRIDGPIEIAWIGIPGETSDLDEEFDTIWVTPVNDPEYVLYKEFEVDEEA